MLKLLFKGADITHVYTHTLIHHTLTFTTTYSHIYSDQQLFQDLRENKEKKLFQPRLFCGSLYARQCLEFSISFH